MLLPAVAISLFLAYGSLILYYYRQWQRIPQSQAAGPMPGPSISVIVPARNEEHRLPALLDSLQDQNYPRERWEVIVVDDHSTDRTAEIAASFARVKLIRLETATINSYKKKAVEIGIAAARHEWIVTTDADCTVKPGWLSVLADHMQRTSALFIAAPVLMKGRHTPLSLFQTLDFMVLQGITGAVVHAQKMQLCNGANLAYKREDFYAVDGFRGIDSIASGDDLLLMQKMARQFPGRLSYLKNREAVVTTGTESSWKDFIRQRIRWGSKSRHYQDKRILPVLALVYLFNLLFPVLSAAGFFNPVYWIWMAGLLAAKIVVEWPFVWAVAGFFQQRSLMKYFPLFQPLHILYTVCIGILSQSGPYEWKGRRVR